MSDPVASMTGFGTASGMVGGAVVHCAVKSVNNRYFKLSARIPESLLPYEREIDQLVRARVERGTVSVALHQAGGGALAVGRVNEARARLYHTALVALARTLGLPEDVSLATLAGLPGVIELDAAPGMRDDGVWEALEPVIVAALDALTQMRRREGAALVEDLRARVALIQTLTAEVAARAPDVVLAYQERLRERIAVLLAASEAAVPAPDLAREVALVADRGDVTEETTRLRVHANAVLEALQAGGAVGRKLDFLTQELLREANTIGAKSSDAEIAARVIAIKAEIERIKEQVQNLE